MSYGLAVSPRYKSATLSAGQTVIDLGSPDPFPIMEAADVEVWRTRSGIRAKLVLNADYAVSLLDQLPGARVTLAAGATAGDIIEVIGYRPIARPNDLLDGNKFSDDALNAEFDSTIIIDQELRRDVGRSLKLAFGVTLAEGHFPKANSAGDMIDGGDADDIVNAQEYAERAEAAALLVQSSVPAAIVTSTAELEALEDPVLRRAARMFGARLYGDYFFESGNYTAAVALDIPTVRAGDGVAASAGAWVKRYYGLPRAREDYNAVADGASFDHEAIQDCLDREGSVQLSPLHRLGAMLVVPGDDCTIEGAPQGTKFKMATSAGRFDNATYVNTGNAWGLKMVGRARPKVRRIHFEMEAIAAIRTAGAIYAESCTDVLWEDIEASGFKELYHAAIYWNSCDGITLIRPYAHDFLADQVSLGSCQVTAIGCDGERIAIANSKDCVIDNPRVRNIRLSSAAAIAWGDQCDAINVTGFGPGGSGQILNPQIYGIGGEGIDIFAHDWTIVGGEIREVAAYGLKAIHGCARLDARGLKIIDTGGPAILLGGSNGQQPDSLRYTGTNGCAAGAGSIVVDSVPSAWLINGAAIALYNSVQGWEFFTVSGIVGTTVSFTPNTVLAFNSDTTLHPVATGAVTQCHIEAQVRGAGSMVPPSGATYVKAAVHTDGGSATYEPQDNFVYVKADNTGYMASVADVSSGADNRIEYDYDSVQTIEAVIDSGVAANGNIVRRRRKTSVRATLSSASNLANGAVLPFGTEVKDVNGEWDAGTFTFTSKGFQNVRVRCVFTTGAGAVEAGKFVDMLVTRAGSGYANKLEYNQSVGAKQMCFEIDVEVPCVPGTTITVKIEHDNASTVLAPSTSTARTYLEIQSVES